MAEPIIQLKMMAAYFERLLREMPAGSNYLEGTEVMID